MREMLHQEFERQCTNLLQKGYPAAAGLTAEAFLQHLEPLREQLAAVKLPTVDLVKGQLPFVIVVKREWMGAEDAMARVERQGKPGVTKLYPRTADDFQCIEKVSLPEGAAYLLVDIDRGQESLNVTPKVALEQIWAAGRSPLTIEEGIALVTHYPEFLQKNNCFSLLAARYSGDKRVPAIWISGEKRPNLGWCWEGNPHTWLGSASCGGRVGTTQAQQLSTQQKQHSEQVV